MRVTAATKAQTRRKILEAARRLFAEGGFDATTTRDIARAAGIASGTLFNYFTTKEAVVAALAVDAVGDVASQFASGPSAAQTLAEELFALIAAELRKLRPLRRHLPSLLETSLCPISREAVGDAAALRTSHLEAVVAIAARQGVHELTPVALQLYWTLYTGVLLFWANDQSPRQEETLALLDQSLAMFTGWLHDQSAAQDPAGPY